MNNLLEYVKNANVEDLEQLKMIIGLLVSELESMLSENDLEYLEELLLEEIGVNYE